MELPQSCIELSIPNPILWAPTLVFRTPNHHNLIQITWPGSQDRFTFNTRCHKDWARSYAETNIFNWPYDIMNHVMTIIISDCHNRQYYVSPNIYGEFASSYLCMYEYIYSNLHIPNMNKTSTTKGHFRTKIVLFFSQMGFHILAKYIYIYIYIYIYTYIYLNTTVMGTRSVIITKFSLTQKMFFIFF